MKQNNKLGHFELFIFRKKILASLVLFLYLIVFSSIVFAQNENTQIYRYVVRGVISKLPTTETSKSLFIKHEPIPEYVDERGIKVGMASMNMSFTLGENVSIKDFKPGDRVEFTLESWWNPRPGDSITQIEKIE